jgi:hypothetical protein
MNKCCLGTQSDKNSTRQTVPPLKNPSWTTAVGKQVITTDLQSDYCRHVFSFHTCRKSLGGRSSTQWRIKTTDELHFALTFLLKPQAVLRLHCIWYVRYEVLTAANMRMAVFWVVAPCSLVEVHRRFRRACCLHHQGDRPDYQTTRRNNPEESHLPCI